MMAAAMFSRSRHLTRAAVNPAFWRATPAFSTETVYKSDFDPIPEGPYGNLASYLLKHMASYGDKTLIIEAHSGDKRSYKEVFLLPLTKIRTEQWL